MQSIQDKANRVYPVTNEKDIDGNDTNYERRCAFIQGYSFCELDHMQTLNSLLDRYPIIDAREFINEFNELKMKNLRDE